MAKLNGIGLAYVGTGFILLWSGFKNITIKQTLTAALSGNATALEQQGSEYTLTSATTSGTSATGGSSTAPDAGSNSTGAANGCSASQTSSNKALGKLLATGYGWGTGAEWNALNGVVMLESGWCNTAQNPESTAYGIGQFLDTTWAETGYVKTSNPLTQIAAMLVYIKKTYGTPEKAYSFHIQNGYY